MGTGLKVLRNYLMLFPTPSLSHGPTDPFRAKIAVHRSPAPPFCSLPSPHHDTALSPTPATASPAFLPRLRLALHPTSTYTEAATRLFASPTPPSFFLRPGASSPLGWYKIFSPSSSLHPRILLRDGSSRGSRAVGGFESGGEWNAQAPSVGHEPALGSCWEGAASSGRELALQRLSPSVLLPITDQSWPTASRVQRLRRRLRTRRPQGRAAEWGKQGAVPAPDLLIRLAALPPRTGVGRVSSFFNGGRGSERRSLGMSGRAPSRGKSETGLSRNSSPGPLRPARSPRLAAQSGITLPCPLL
ncbi:hypothetical protein GH733_019422 [Mirounga leonina]|nr:hypothetical protein GH733_019422 [Mirounga leonina]